MTTTSPTEVVSATHIRTGWYSPDHCQLGDLMRLTEQQTMLADYPFADAVERNALIYGGRIRDHIGDPVSRRTVQAELAKALTEGPGIVVFKGAYDGAVIDQASVAFRQLIDLQNANGAAPGDHFAKPGENDRVWGALDKLALLDPATFVSYYANDFLALVSESWLGPNYRITSQLNVVNPGGRAQTAHRDYHLGIQDAVNYPAHVQTMSAFLTLQGAIAHVDMPVESGPTMYLPYSHQLPDGYVAVNNPEFTEYFGANYVQLPLTKGDAVFFNPALFHGAGTNKTTDVLRMANLLQVSSCFGRAMEAVDTTAICKAIYANLTELVASGTDPAAVRNLITAAADGYPFPTNLDRDLPGATLSPPTQADVLREALDKGWGSDQLGQVLDAQQSRRAPAQAVSPSQP